MPSAQTVPGAAGFETPAPARNGPKQARSRRTLEQFVASAEKLIIEHSFDGASVTDICDHAGLSVGAFYRRFESKEGLLNVVHERYTERAIAALEQSLDPSRWTNKTLDEILRRWLVDAWDMTTENWGLTRASSERCFADPRFAARERAIYDRFLELFIPLVLSHKDEIAHPHPRIAVEYCAYQISAVLHFINSGIVGDQPKDQLADGELVNELTKSSLAYLRHSPHRESASARPRRNSRARRPNGPQRSGRG